MDRGERCCSLTSSLYAASLLCSSCCFPLMRPFPLQLLWNQRKNEQREEKEREVVDTYVLLVLLLLCLVLSPSATVFSSSPLPLAFLVTPYCLLSVHLANRYWAASHMDAWGSVGAAFSLPRAIEFVMPLFAANESRFDSFPSLHSFFGHCLNICSQHQQNFQIGCLPPYFLILLLVLCVSPP